MRLLLWCSHARGVRRSVRIACVAALAACAQTAAPPAERTEAPVEDSPEARERAAAAAAFFSDPLLSHVRISPDGSHIAAIAERDGEQVLLVRPTLGGEVQSVAKVGKRSVQVANLGWASDERLIVSIDMPHDMAAGVRARKTRLLAVNRDGSGIKYLGKRWPYQEWSQSQDNVLSWLPDDPDHILLNWWNPSESGASVKEVAVGSGALSPVVRYETHVFQWEVDHREQVRAGWGYKVLGRKVISPVYFLYARAEPDGRFEKLIEFDAFDEEGFYFAGFSEDPTRIYVFSDTETGRFALYEYDLTSQQMGPMVFGHPRFGLDPDQTTLTFSKKDGRLLCIDYFTERPERHFLDEEARREQAAIDRALPDTINSFIVSRRGFMRSDRDERIRLVYAYADVRPPVYYLYDRERMKLEPLVAALPDVDAGSLAPMRPVTFTARDGLEIDGYLTLPKGAEPRDLPTIVYPHGGPSARDVWGFDPTVQFLASRGFAVFQLNFRGSTGYGRRHTRLGFQQWGLTMQDDITDGVRWLVDEGISDPERIGIYGASYGGYAALMGLVKTPELFRAGASFVGVSHLQMLLEDDAWYGWRDFNVPAIGGELVENSPIHNADRIRAPVLIAHGSEDWRVHMRHATMMASTLEKAGKEVELYIYEGDVHGFIYETNRIDFYIRLASFFEKHLAPRNPEAAAR
jgi:dienelactone hydrolase